MTAHDVKEIAISLGGDVCGIASIDRFEQMPPCSHPKAICPNANSVIVVAKKFLRSTAGVTSTIPYTIIRNALSRVLDDITIQLSYHLEEQGYQAIPTGAIDPCNYHKELGKTVGLLSLKHAAYQAGLGVIGKNTLLLTPEWGNMIWLGAVITSLSVEADRIRTHNPCHDRCRICLDQCPVGALDGSLFMDQQTCWDFAFGKDEDGGEWRIKCFQCRTRCPYSQGYDEPVEV